MRDGRLVENFPWSVMGRHQQAKVVRLGPGRLSGWHSGPAAACCISRMARSAHRTHPLMGWAKARSPAFNLIAMVRCGPQHEEGGLSRIKDGRVATLTTRNGLPCDTIHWSMEDDDRSLWLYAACGLVRITRTELDAWIADPKRRIETAVWDAADGVRLCAASPAYYNPPVAKSTDGRLWFLMGEGVAVVDPHHLVINNVPPPVSIERIIADHKPYWQNTPGAAVSAPRLPARIRDLQIDFTALSLVAPEKVHFKYKLEGQDHDWREVVNERQAQYTNLRPGTYTVPRHREQQQRGVERAGRQPGVLGCPGVQPDELVSRTVCGRFHRATMGGSPDPPPASAASVRDDAGCARRRAHTHCARASRHPASERTRCAAAVPDCFRVVAGAPDGGESKAGQGDRADGGVHHRSSGRGAGTAGFYDPDQ